VATLQTAYVPFAPHPRRIDRRLSVLLLAVALLSLVAARPLVAQAKDGDDQVRVKGTCGKGAASELTLKSGHDGLELQFKLHHSRAGDAWRVVVVQERRIAWKGAAKAAGSNGSFELRRTLPDLPGSDAVTVRAWGPHGLGCRATAILAESSN
jgi:hypothetical protein